MERLHFFFWLRWQTASKEKPETNHLSSCRTCTFLKWTPAFRRRGDGGSERICTGSIWYSELNKGGRVLRGCVLISPLALSAPTDSWFRELIVSQGVGPWKYPRGEGSATRRRSTKTPLGYNSAAEGEIVIMFPITSDTKLVTLILGGHLQSGLIVLISAAFIFYKVLRCTVFLKKVWNDMIY